MNRNLPRSHECGPVEARGVSRALSASLAFRALTSAAPLKQCASREYWTPGCTFRALTSAAPLKLRDDVVHCELRDAPSALSRVRPR